MNTTIRRAVTTATAALTTLALTVPTAGADTTGPDVFAGTADALALEVRVTGPQELIGPLTEDGSNTLVQRISLTSTDLASDGVGEVTTSLLGGVIEQLSASSTEAGSGSDSFVSQTVGPISAEAGTIEWALDPAADVARSFSELANIRVSLAPILAELPAEVTTALQETVGQATETVNSLVGELNGALDQVEEVVNEVAEQAPVDIPEVLPEELPGVPDVTQVDLLSVRKMWSESTIETVGELARSTAHGGVAELSLLGGLITVPAFQFTSLAETAGTPGTARATTDVTTLAVSIGDYLVAINGTRLSVGDFTIDLADPALEGLPAEDLLGPIEGVLAELLNAGGLSVTQGEGVTSAAPDGSSATASTSAFALRLRPLNAAAPEALDIEVLALPTSAAVSGGVEVQEQGAPALPRTGGGALAMLLGFTAMLGAVGLRKRA